MKLLYTMKTSAIAIAALILFGFTPIAKQAHAAEPFLAEIIMFGGNFAPRGWAFCEGQLLPIAQNTALFSLLGTTYGGDGRTTFGLPDLRGRSPIGVGQAPGLSRVVWGQKGGTEYHTLTTAETPPHNHPMWVFATEGNSSSPANAYLAKAATGAPQYNSVKSSETLKTDAIGNTGGGQPFSIRSPFLGVHFIIALQGVFPSRS